MIEEKTKVTNRRPTGDELRQIAGAPSHGRERKMKWWSVKKRLPPLDRVVLVCFKSGYDGAPYYAFGARLDDSDGWLWGIQSSHLGGVRLVETAIWNGIEADDDYHITHWQQLPTAPFRWRSEPNELLRTHKPPVTTLTADQ